MNHIADYTPVHNVLQRFLWPQYHYVGSCAPHASELALPPSPTLRFRVLGITPDARHAKPANLAIVGADGPTFTNGVFFHCIARMRVTSATASVFFFRIASKVA